MKIYSVHDKEFAAYGRVLTGYNTASLINAMNNILLHDDVRYEPWIESLEKEPLFEQLRDSGFGGMPIQIGMCWGKNTKLNCLEYHRDSEINVGANDFILLVAMQQEIANGVIDSKKVMAFRAAAGETVEVYATTLHYAPCHVNEADGFRVAVVLPRGTNTDKPQIAAKCGDDAMLWARNKWLLAHAESSEAAKGAHLGITGINIDIKDI